MVAISPGKPPRGCAPSSLSTGCPHSGTGNQRPAHCPSLSPWVLVLTGLMVLLAWAVMQISAAVLLLRLDAESPALTFPDEGPHGLPDYTYVATRGVPRAHELSGNRPSTRQPPSSHHVSSSSDARARQGRRWATASRVEDSVTPGPSRSSVTWGTGSNRPQ